MLISMYVSDAIPMLKMAGLQLTIEDHGIVVRRPTTGGRFPWVRTLQYTDSFGNLVSADEVHQIIYLQTK